MRATTSADDSLGVAVLGEVATAYFLKGEPAQAMAFIALAPLQKRNLDSSLQLCLYLRGVGRYLMGDRRHAISDLERLYALNPGFGDVVATKASMQAGSFAFPPARPYPDWYPASHRETALPSEPRQETVDPIPMVTADSRLLPQAAPSADQAPPAIDAAVPSLEQAPATTNGSPIVVEHFLSESEDPILVGEIAVANKFVSPDGIWRWDGTRWIPNSRLETANVATGWAQSELWRSWGSPTNLIRGESRHQDVFLRQWRIDPTHQHWEPVAVDFIREPQNPVDPNAIRAELEGKQIGYLAREVAEIFSAQLDRAGCTRFTIAGVVCGGSTDAPTFGVHVWLDKRITEAPAWAALRT
jgi:hypothetical protein